MRGTHASGVLVLDTHASGVLALGTHASGVLALGTHASGVLALDTHASGVLALGTHASGVLALMKSTYKDRLVLPKQDGFEGWYSRGYFPHFDGQGMTQHVCFHLCDSLPQRFLSQLRAELNASVAADAGGVSADQNHEWRKRVHEFLDSGYGSCALRDERLAKVIEDSLLHFDGDRYALHAWCVMPNHVHTLFTPQDGHKMSTIVHSWKSFTAQECNKLLGQTGRFWDREPFDRYIRNERHFRNTLAYIEENPVKAGLCHKPEEWLWSSARRR